MKIIIIVTILFASLDLANAQNFKSANGEAIVGQPCPDVFFDKTINFSKASFYLHELRGKWVILDLWSMGCGSCVASFPHVSEMQAKFKDKVQFLMGTFDDPKGENEAIYKHFNKMLHLNMPCVFNGKTDITSAFGKPDTSGYFTKFNVGYLPFVVIIDPAGIVRAVTVIVHEEQIQALLNGEMPKFGDAGYSDNRNKIGRSQYDTAVPFLIDGNGGSSSRDEFEYRSIISKWTPKVNDKDQVFAFSPNWPANNKKFPLGRLEWLGANLSLLYQLAYFGLGGVQPEHRNQEVKGDSKFFWPTPVLEMKDSSLFIADRINGKNLFCYSLIVPPSDGTKDIMLPMMQSDLKRYFKYDARLETRSMPCWKLVISDSTLARTLKTKGGKYEDSQPISRVSRKEVDVPMELFSKQVKYYAGLFDMPFINETGIEYNVDAYYEFVPNHIESMNDALRKFGLKIIRSEKAMEVLVIGDPVPLQSQIGSK